MELLTARIAIDRGRSHHRMPEIVLHVMPRRRVFSEDTTLRERAVRVRRSRHNAPREELRRAEVEASAKTQLAPYPRAREDWRASPTDFDDLILKIETGGIRPLEGDNDWWYSCIPGLE